jgi:hypothetical protein
MFVVVVVVVVTVVVLCEKSAKTVCLTSLVQALTTIIDITVCWESPKPNWSNIDFVLNMKSKSPMGGDYFYFKICLDD